jgi:hypothetical protein
MLQMTIEIIPPITPSSGADRKTPGEWAEDGECLSDRLSD